MYDIDYYPNLDDQVTLYTVDCTHFGQRQSAEDSYSTVGLLMGLCRYRSSPTDAHAITGLLRVDIYSPLPRGSDPVTQNTADRRGS